MAGAGYKLFNTGDVLTAAQVNTYLQEQAVMRFANSTARTTALSGVLAEGMISYLDDTNAVEVYNGSAWVGVSGAGDLTEVQAGTGISVASGTGPIPVVTNTMATTIDAKGDLIVGTGADTFARLAVSATNGHTLQVDSSTSTGLKWAAASSTPTYVGCAVTQSGDDTIANNVNTKVTWDTEDFDTDGFHSTTTNKDRFTIPSGKAGKYLFEGTVRWDNNASGIRELAIWKNGTVIKQNWVIPGADPSHSISWVGSLAVGDYVSLYVYQNSGGNRNLYFINNQAWASITYLGV